jgi:hypothetical protein
VGGHIYGLHRWPPKGAWQISHPHGG